MPTCKSLVIPRPHVPTPKAGKPVLPKPTTLPPPGPVAAEKRKEDRIKEAAERKAKADANEIVQLNDETGKNVNDLFTSVYESAFQHGLEALKKKAGGMEDMKPVVAGLANANRNLHNNALLAGEQSYRIATRPQEGDTPEKVAARERNARSDFDKAKQSADAARDKRQEEIDAALVEGKQRQKAALDKAVKAFGEATSGLQEGGDLWKKGFEADAKGAGGRGAGR